MRPAAGEGCDRGAYCAAHGHQDEGFEDELQADGAVGGANGLQDTDLASAFADQHDHDQQDDEPGSTERRDESDEGDVLDAAEGTDGRLQVLALGDVCLVRTEGGLQCGFGGTNVLQ